MAGSTTGIRRLAGVVVPGRGLGAAIAVHTGPLGTEKRSGALFGGGEYRCAEVARPAPKP
jgi:hypothetical protein